MSERPTPSDCFNCGSANVGFVARRDRWHSMVCGKCGAEGLAGETVDEAVLMWNQMPAAARYACNVCQNVPDADGALEHGRGCYVMSSDGGGTEFIPEAIVAREPEGGRG